MELRQALERKKKRVPEWTCALLPSRTVFVPKPSMMARLRVATATVHFHKLAGGSHGGSSGDYVACIGTLGCKKHSTT